jgi:flagellar hook-associated protein 1
MSISGLLSTARESLNVNQMAIDITGGNIANVNTPSYTRQRVDMTSINNVNVNGVSAQVGVGVGQVKQIYDRFINSQIVEQQQNTGYSDATLQGLQNIQGILDDTNGGGLNDQLNSFWAAWESLSQNPGGQVERSTLLSTAQNLTSTLTTYKQGLDSINKEMNNNIAGVVAQINSDTSQIADMNFLIMGPAGNNGDKNDLIDKRSQLLKDLGSLVNINQSENADGTINIYLPDGRALVESTNSQSLSVTIGGNARSSVEYSADISGGTLNSALTKGKLGAFVQLQDTIIPEYMNDLNDFTTTLSNRVNGFHKVGFDAYGNTGTDFFTITDAANAAGTIGVNSVIAADVNRIAASVTVSGDGGNANQIASVQNELLMNSNTSTLNSFLSSMVGQIGSQVADAKTNSDYQTAIMNSLNNQWQSISGVSIDEEMINLMKYQMGYNAAGRLITTVNSLLDTLMGIIK